MRMDVFSIAYGVHMHAQHSEICVVNTSIQWTTKWPSYCYSSWNKKSIVVNILINFIALLKVLYKCFMVLENSVHTQIIIMLLERVL